MHNGWAVCSVGPSGPQKSSKVFTRVLLKQQKQKLSFLGLGQEDGQVVRQLGGWQAGLGLQLSADQSLGLWRPSHIGRSSSTDS